MWRVCGWVAFEQLIRGEPQIEIHGGKQSRKINCVQQDFPKKRDFPGFGNLKNWEQTKQERDKLKWAGERPTPMGQNKGWSLGSVGWMEPKKMQAGVPAAPRRERVTILVRNPARK